jgi:DNA-binding NtrC family response regulator
MAEPAGPILLVEDTPSLAEIYRRYLAKEGYRVEHADSAEAARRLHAAARFPVVLLDLQLPDGDGLDLMRELDLGGEGQRTIVITANGSINRAVAAMRAGAFDFVVKPFDEARLLTAVQQAFLSIADDAANPPASPAREAGFQGFIGGSPVMRAVYETIRGVGRSSASVFITGESGTGKEVCAQAVHAISPRRDGPFIALNCGAIPRDLLESEVFGHLRGSFTGAIADKVGAAAAADGGTLFLDEICEMDIELQTKLLRFVQTSTIQPVGATTPRKVDVRILCATNRDPEAEVAAGRFRADLFYRLYVVPIRMPALRDRGDDILEIAETLLARYAAEERKLFTGFADDAVACLRAYRWPGNVRELQNVLRNIAVLRDGVMVTRDMLPAAIAGASERRVETTAIDTPGPETEEGRRAILKGFVGLPLEVVERDYIETTIAACGGSITRAARLLDVSPSTIYRKREAWKARGH